MPLSKWLDRVTLGDCLDVLRELPDCSVDLCATDPPYALTSGTGAKGGFMGKAWDAALPARAIWAEVFRVLKPGASCFVCAGARQDTLLGMLTDLREVGFDIQHAALSWVYWSGFPKSSCVSKQFDKAAFLAWLREVPPGETETRQALMGWDAADARKAASAAVNGAYSAEPVERWSDEGCYASNGANRRPWMEETAKGTGTLLLAALQARFGDAPGVRAKVGEGSTQCGLRRFQQVGHEQGYRDRTDSYMTNGAQPITAPATPDAIAWDGWHSGSVPLKPASEQVLWVTKPAEPGPARGNVLKWGTGACNIGECRVPVPAADHSALHGSTRGPVSGKGYVGNFGLQCNYEPVEYNPSGRYPSNLLVTARALGDDSKYGDLDAWAREHGISDEWLDAALSAGVLRVPKPSRSEKNAGCDDRNGHPTVKPVTLFAFLCVLACPRGGVVLDPFLGSGTTAVAAVQCGAHFLGIEREPEYVAIADARIAAALRDRQPALDLEAAQ